MATITISARERRGTLTIQTFYDEVGGENEIFLVRLSGATNADLGTTSNEALGRMLDDILADEANEVILPQIAVAVATEKAMMVKNRVRDAFEGREETSVTMRGSGLGQFIASQAQSADEHAEMPELEWTDLTGLAFNIAADDSTEGANAVGWRGPGRGVLDDISVWGRGYYKGVEADGAIDFDGGIVGGMIGADTLLKKNFLGGLGVNFFQSDIDFSKAGSGTTTRTGKHEVTAWSVNPYLGWKPTDRMTLWATFGFGLGSSDVEQTAVWLSTSRLRKTRERRNADDHGRGRKRHTV